MEFNFLNKKGQVSIEFILILVVVLLYIQVLVIPVVRNAIMVGEDVTALAQAKSSAQKLVNAVDFVQYSTGDSQITLNLFAPKNTRLIFDSAARAVNFTALIEGEPEFLTNVKNSPNKAPGTTCTDVSPTSITCTGNLEVIDGVPLTGSVDVGGENFGVLSKVRVSKDSTSNTVTVSRVE